MVILHWFPMFSRSASSGCFHLFAADQPPISITWNLREIGVNSLWPHMMKSTLTDLRLKREWGQQRSSTAISRMVEWWDDLPPTHAVSANRILWVYAGFWWYHGILVVHLQDSVGAFGAKWLTKWLHHAKAPPRRGVLRWEWSNKDVHLVTTFVFCHVSKC